MSLRDSIQRLAASSDEIYCKICTVDAIHDEERTVDCTPLDDSALLVDVNLQVNQSGVTGIILWPKVGSYVLVAFMSTARAAVVLADEVERIELRVGDTQLKVDARGVVANGGQLGGMVKINELTDRLNALIDAFNSHTHEIPSGAVAVTGSATAQANPVPVSVPPVSAQHPKMTASDYEDDKIKH